MTFTYTSAQWEKLADTLELGYPAVPFGTGTACRIAPDVAGWIRDQVGDAESDPIDLTLDWDGAYVVGCGLQVAGLEGGDHLD